MTHISVIIPTLNAERELRLLLGSLRNQTIACEVIIVDSSSSDSTVDVAKTHSAKVIHIEQDKFDHGGTRNLGAQAAKGDILVFLTQDVMPVNDCLIANLIVPLQDERIAYCYGRQISRQDAVPVERFARLFNYPEWPLVKGKDDIRRLGIKAFFCSNACSAVKRREFEDMGGFLEGLIMNEDMFFAAKVIMNGYQIAYEPSAAVYHSHNYSLLNQFKRYFDIGAAIGSNGLLLDMAEAEGEGARFIKEGMRYLAQEGQSKWIPYFLIQGFLKYCGYCLGLKEKALPAGIKRCLSMHKQYWLKRKL